MQAELKFHVAPIRHPDAPEDFGTGRKCIECKVNKVNRYAIEGMCYTCRTRKIDERLKEGMLKAELERITEAPDTKLRSLKVYRLRLGLSQTQLARRVGTKKPHISMLERGKCGAGAALSGRLANVIGVTVAQLRAPAQKL